MTTIKKILISTLLTFGLMGTASSEVISGGIFDGTDVGGIDIYIDEIANMGSGAQTEIDWVNSVLGTSFGAGDLTKEEPVAWYSTTTADVIAFALQTGPGYYLIKNSRLHVLFNNVVDVDWGVINLNDIIGDINLNDDFMISHVSEFGGATRVPEPGTLLLLGGGLLGLSLIRRRRSDASI